MNRWLWMNMFSRALKTNYQPYYRKVLLNAQFTIELLDVNLDPVTWWLSIGEITVNYDNYYYLLYIDNRHIEVLGINMKRIIAIYEKLKKAIR